MKRYLAILGTILGTSASVVVFFIAMQNAWPYVKSGKEWLLVDIPPTCGIKAAAAINSVYPDAEIANVQFWYCARTLKDKFDPNGARCYGKYRLTLHKDVWVQKVWAIDGTGGFGKWKPIPGGVDRINNTVTVERTTDIILLDADQLIVHASLFSSGCIRDDNDEALQWGEIVDFTISRDDYDNVSIKSNYATSTTNPLDAAEDAEQDKALWPLAEE